MNKISRTIAGIAMIIVGLGMIMGAFFSSFFLLIYGIPIFILGIVIFFNKGEDIIEEIKMKGGKK